MDGNLSALRFVTIECFDVRLSILISSAMNDLVKLDPGQSGISVAVGLAT